MSDCKSCSWADLAKNAAKAAASAVKHVVQEGYVIADDAIIKARKSICDGCEFKSGLRCLACGCFIEAKAMLVTEACPKNRWSNVGKL
jgi:hypothetical protein